MKSEPEYIRKILSCNIKKFRGILSYTQEKLAEKAGLSSQTLNDIEGCRRWVSSKTLSKLANALSVNEYQLLLPEKSKLTKKSGNSSIKSLTILKKEIKNAIDVKFEEAIDSGKYK